MKKRGLLGPRLFKIGQGLFQEMKAPVVISVLQKFLHANRRRLVGTAIHSSDISRIGSVNGIRPSEHSSVSSVRTHIYCIDVVHPGGTTSTRSKIKISINEENVLLRLIIRQNVTSTSGSARIQINGETDRIGAEGNRCKLTPIAGYFSLLVAGTNEDLWRHQFIGNESIIEPSVARPGSTRWS